MAPLPRLTFELCDQFGETLPGGHVAYNRKVSAARNRFMEIKLTLGLHDEAARRLFDVLPNGAPQLRVWLGKTLVFAGYWTPMEGGHATGEAGHVNLTFRDAFARLYRRFTDELTVFTAEDAGLIANTLIVDYDTFLGGDPIQTDAGFVELTQERDRTYEHKVIGDAITELTEVLGGFDWWPVYLDAREHAQSTMEFHVAASAGSDRPDARFEFGDGTLHNCTGYQFAVALPINWTRAIGSGSPPLFEDAFDLDSVSIWGFEQQLVSASDVSEPATLLAKAQDALRPLPVFVTAFQPDPAKSPLPWRDFWISDRVRFNVSDGAMQQQFEPRVQTIDFALDDSDNVTDLTIGIDPAGAGSYMPPANTTRAYVQQQQELRRRLSALERRA